MTAESHTLPPPVAQQFEIPYHSDSSAYAQILADKPYFTWLDSSTDPNQGRYDILTAEPDTWFEMNQACLQEFSRSKQNYQVTNTQRNITVARFFSHLQTALDIAEQHSRTETQLESSTVDLPFQGGLMGYFGYNLGNQLYGIVPTNRPKTVGLPDAAVGFYSWAFVVDHQTKKSWLVAHKSCAKETIDQLVSEVNQLFESPINLNLHSDEYSAGPFNAELPPAAYSAQLASVQKYIQAGDCYQVNFTHCFSAPFKGSTLAAYRQLRQALPSPFSAYIEFNNHAVLSVSPERLLELNNNNVEARPIKGTIPRGKTPEEDKRNAQTLLNSEKDRAENLMIVDLLRNDISKVCEYYSVKVPELFSLESYKNVHHLVSCITGELKPEHTALDLIAACFPGGSITGAPKKRAMEIISELENTERSVYCGSIGYISTHGHADTNIAIRSVVYDGEKVYCWGGGGIVADSDSEAEHKESLNKIQLIMDTLTGLNPRD